MIRYGGVVGGDEEIAAVTAVLRGQEWAPGAVTAQFEQAAAEKQGRAHALFVNSGSSALLLALATLPEGCEVAMPALQFPTLFSAALWCNLRPVLVDVDDSLNMDPLALEVAIQRHPGVRAAAFVHMAGNPAGAAAVAWACRNYGLTLIEDICEAFGAQGQVKAGNSGKLAATSTHAAHQISTGQGGLVFTDDHAAHAEMRRIRDWGRSYGKSHLGGYYPGYVFTEVGLNLGATDIQAALGLVQLGRLDGFVQARRRNWETLAAKTAHLPVQLPRVDRGHKPSWYAFPMLTADRDRLAEHLEAAGIETRPIVAGNMARQPMAAARDPGRWPMADRVFREGLWVSVHPSLSAADVAYVADALCAFWD